MTIRKKAGRNAKGLTPAKRRRREVEPEPDERRDIVLRSEGQRLLLEVEGTIKEIGTSCGVSHQTVIDWRFGRRVPGPPARAALWNAYEIPAAAWGRLPAGMQRAPAPVIEVTGDGAGFGQPVIGTNGNGHGNGHASPAAELASAPSSLNETAQLLAAIRAQLAERDLLPADRTRITDTYTKTLALQHRLQRDVDLTEDRIIREHPTWQRIRAELARVLARHPQAASEVCDALERLNV